MYITSDLFGSGSGSDDIHDRCESSTTSTPTWNTVADSRHVALGKRKRRMDMDPAEGPKSSSDYSSLQRLSPSAGREMLKRHCLGHTVTDNNNWTTVPPQGPMHLVPETRPQKQLRRTASKKHFTLIKSNLHLMEVENDTSPASSSSSSNTSTALDLRACHICHTAPKRKKVLENYQECKRCTEHTCFICVRQCADGCREKICRKCCVEVGEEGDTLCLGCYARSLNS